MAPVDPTEQLADRIEQLWLAGASKRAMSQHGLNRPYAGRYCDLEALDLIRFPLAGRTPCI